MLMANVVVFDIGGTKIHTTVFNEAGEDLLGGRPLKTDTPIDSGPDEFTAVLARQISNLSSRHGDVICWGAAFPGPYRRGAAGELIVMPRNIPKMRDLDFEGAMRKHLPSMTGYVDNDLKLALWGEYVAGSARGYDNVIGFVHSTGVSSAAIMDGEIVRGPGNNAGEIGCLLVERDSHRALPCDAQFGAKSGHLEAQIRGPALAQKFFGVERNDATAVRSALEGASEEDKSQMVEYCVPYVVQALAPMCELVCATRVVLHGGIADYLGSEYASALGGALREASETFGTMKGQVVLSEKGAMAPLIGAADLTLKKAAAS